MAFPLAEVKAKLGWQMKPFSSRPVQMRLWWAIPKVLAGTSMPLVQRSRYERPGSAHDEYEDDLSFLYRAGIRAIVSLIDFPALSEIYTAMGFERYLMPVPDGAAPTMEQFAGFAAFVDQQRARGHAVAVHCLAGRGRTGTVNAGYLIAKGATAEAALAHIRRLVPQAVETAAQLGFLSHLERQATR